MTTSKLDPSTALTKPLRLHAEFMGLPHAERLTLSDFYLVPFYDDQDFESFEILGRQRRWPWPRTLLNYAQKDQLLSATLAAVNACCQGSGAHIILNSRMPSTQRIPAAMLDEHVFVVLDVEVEARRYTAQGRSVITLQEGLLRYSTESGNNEIVMAWHLPPTDGAQRLQTLALQLQQLGFALRGRAA